MERAFTKGTFGASKKRSRIIQKRLSDMSADSNALGHGHAAVGDMSESYRGLGELPTPPASAMSLNDQHHQRLESLQEEEQEPPATGSAVPERRRTRSSRRPSHRQHHHHAADNPASSHRQVLLPGGYVPPPSMGSVYATQPETRVQGAAAADYRLQQLASDETSHQDSRHRNSRHHRPAAQPSPGAVEQTAKSSGGCCGCTIM
ncbi:hypothetical protein GGI03_007509 [Coemansia sp. RSA 2337]|nr:hypothetical protein GGI03_007509 [Coemansia sp. RSA 2337]